MYKCCKQLYEKDDEKIEKFKTAFHIAAVERPLDDYKSLCALQKLNGEELGETYLTRSACTEFIDHISSDYERRSCCQIEGVPLFLCNDRWKYGS